MTKFNQYLASLAPEGETMLFVEQVVKADGKTFWMPYYPTEDKTGALYCNTASFITDRFPNQRKPKAQSEFADMVAVLVLDDIGTKSKAPPLEPTWKMTTSAGNQQWGYTFNIDHQPTKNEFSAAVKAIAEAGYTDAGMTNPVRNFRIEGSVNLKEGKGNYISHVSDFDPTREFTLADICAALGVTPAEADTAVAGGIRIEDDGADIVLRWLSEHDQVLEPTNADGWTGVICPNYEEHTTGIEGGRYNSITRAFSCFHGHCAHITSETYAQYVENNGGPHYDRGYRSDLVFGRLSANLAKAGLTPTEAYPNRTEEIIAEVERKEMGRTAKQGWFTRFAYVPNEDAYFDIEERALISRRAFDAMFRHIECKSIHGEKKPKIPASYCYDENRQAMGAHTLDGLTYAAGDSVLAVEEGRVYGNRWIDSRRTGADADASIWLQHVERMVPDADVRAHVLDTMAFKLQTPKKKINHAILHYGVEGAGKDAMWSPFFHAIGMRNVVVNDVDQISGDWGYSLENEVIVFNELKEASANERRALANRLKGLIAAPPDKLEVRRKGEHPYMIPNRAFVMAFTNHPSAISLASTDRRWMCIHSTAPRMDEADAKALWGWYERGGGYDAVAGYLLRRNIAHYNPSAPPMATDFKTNMIEMGRGDAETYLLDMMRNCQGEFSKGVVAGPWNKLIDILQSGLANNKLYKGILMEAFKEAGWVDKGLMMSKQHTNKRHLFCHPDMADRPSNELRRIVEEPVELKVVK